MSMEESQAKGKASKSGSKGGKGKSADAGLEEEDAEEEAGSSSDLPRRLAAVS